MSPEVTQFPAVAPHNEQIREPADGMPTLGRSTRRLPLPQLCERGAQSFPEDAAIAQPDFVDSRMAWRAFSLGSPKHYSHPTTRISVLPADRHALRGEPGCSMRPAPHALPVVPRQPS